MFEKCHASRSLSVGNTLVYWWSCQCVVDPASISLILPVCCWSCLGLLNTLPYRTHRICIWLYIRHFPKSASKYAPNRAYPHFVCKWHIIHILAWNPIYFGVESGIFRCNTLHQRETLHNSAWNHTSGQTLNPYPCKQARTAMTHLIHIKLQYLFTNMMQCVTLTCMYLRLSVLRISCFSYCICWFHAYSRTWCILWYIHVFRTYSEYIRDLRARQQVFNNPIRLIPPRIPASMLVLLVYCWFCQCLRCTFQWRYGSYGITLVWPWLCCSLNDIEPNVQCITMSNRLLHPCSCTSRVWIVG